MFRLRKLGNGTDAAEALMTKIGFAFRCLAYVPLLGVLVFVPPFLCSGDRCQPADFANGGLTLSLVFGLLAAFVWVCFVFSRVYGARATKVFVGMSSPDRMLLLPSVIFAVAALLLMMANQP